MSGYLRRKNVWNISSVYLEMHVENVYIKCSIEILKRLEEQRSLSAKIYTRGEKLLFRNYVLALCHEMATSGKVNQLQPKIIIPRINQVYKKSKVYRLARAIHESTRLIAGNFERVLAARAMNDCPLRNHHPNRIQCLLLALKFKQSLDTPHPGPFLEVLKHRNYIVQNTCSFENTKETGSILLLLW